MTKYRTDLQAEARQRKWREGFHPPRAVSAEDAYLAIASLAEPTPEALLKASKAKRHCLHGDLWSEPDDVWAQRGRLARCRSILQSIEETVLVGQKEITVRSIECVRTRDDEGVSNRRWYRIDEVINDDDVCAAYRDEILRLQEQATAKMARYIELVGK